MPDAGPGWAKTVQAALESLTGWRRQIVITGLAVAVVVYGICYLMERRLAGEANPTALTATLGLVLDAKLVAMGVVAIIVILAWLAAMLYALYRNR